jgi:hypothetical protein
MTGSPTKWSAACFNISPAIAASGRERRAKMEQAVFLPSRRS